ncbi:diaminopimelate epimerase, partial [Mesorhizobium sp. M7A.F.Ca.US.006.04.2.1]
TRTGRSVSLWTPGGGTLHVEWRDDDHVVLTGAAEWEFSGNFDPSIGTWARDTESAA